MDPRQMEFPVSSGFEHREKEYAPPLVGSEAIKESYEKATTEVKKKLSNETISQMFKVQKEYDKWEALNMVPMDIGCGIFTGDTGVNCLSKKELEVGRPAWARKGQFD